MKPIPDYMDSLPLEEFVDACKVSFFEDSEIHAYYGTATEVSDTIAWPSRISQGYIDNHWTHVHYYYLEDHYGQEEDSEEGDSPVS